MNQHELTTRLLALKIKKADFAKMLGIHPATVYHWKETPRYVESLLVAIERLAGLGVRI